MKTAYVTIEFPKQECGGSVISDRLKEYVTEVVGGGQLTVFSYQYGQNFRELEERIEKGGFDAVVYNGSYHGIRGHFKKTVTFFHNVEFLYAWNEYRNKFRAFGVFRKEASHVRRSDVVITLNERDSGVMKRLYGRSADFIWPATYTDRFRGDYAYDGSEYILFVGTNFFGNTEGLDWFIRKCMPGIDLPLKVVGRGMDELAQKYDDPKIEFTGYVDSLDDYYYNASAVVLPILSGSGMKTKTCEALMFGKTVIGTDEAFEGYEGVDDAGCIRCNTAESFIQAVNGLKAGKYNGKIRELFLRKYSDDAVKSNVMSFLEKTLMEAADEKASV